MLNSKASHANVDSNLLIWLRKRKGGPIKTLDPLYDNHFFFFWNLLSETKKKDELRIKTFAFHFLKMSNKKAGWHYFVGKAYPGILRGENPTKKITSNPFSKDIYHDPAVKLSDRDMRDFKSFNNFPICYEHKKHDVVGEISHAYVDENDKRALIVYGGIPPTKRGKEVVEEIKSGKLKGLSVSYHADIDASGGSYSLREKLPREISLTADPFFKGCNLLLNVAASGATANAVEEGKNLGT